MPGYEAFLVCARKNNRVFKRHMSMIHEQKGGREGEGRSGRRGKTPVAVNDVFRSANFIQPSRLHPSAPTIAIIFLGFCEKNARKVCKGEKKSRSASIENEG